MALIESPSSVGWIRRLERERDHLKDGVAVAMVNVLIEHCSYEAKRDWGAVMATLADDAVYRTTGYGISGVRVRTKNEQHRAYEEEERLLPGLFARLEMDLDRFLVGTDVLAFDGRVYGLFAGTELGALGLSLGESDSGADQALVSWRQATFMAFRDGRIIVKNGYIGHPRIENHTGA